eukprot:TRINITY_DN16492_c0_g1_i1.p1 TRINITY_DN16492_c0_g1~~TRINITY_DN16492_c0_g1_i1.p1  ORF type:complete len:737 (+),score=49.10 TRINITY_DN16492_c0_g1_i1:98-2308(+)
MGEFITHYPNGPVSLNPRSIRFAHSTISGTISTPRGAQPIDDAIREVLQWRSLPNWPPIRAVWVEEGNDCAFRAIDGNRRLYIARAAWSLGAIGAVKVRICDRNDPCVAAKLCSALSTASHGHDVDVLPRSIYRGQQLSRKVQEDFRDFVHKVAEHCGLQEQSAEIMTRLARAGFKSVDQLHKLTPCLATMSQIPSTFWSELHPILRDPCAYGDLLLAEGTWFSDDGSHYRISGWTLQGPNQESYALLDTCSDVVLRDDSSRRAFLSVFKFDGIDIRLLKWNSEQESPSGTWMRYEPVARDAEITSESVVVTEERAQPVSFARNEDSEKKLSIGGSDEAGVQWLTESSGDELRLACLLIDGKPFWAVYASNGASILSRASEILAVTSKQLADSADEECSYSASPVISKALTAMTGVWSMHPWQLRTSASGKHQAVGVQGKWKGREQAAKLALALAMHLDGFHLQASSCSSEFKALVQRAQEILRQQAITETRSHKALAHDGSIGDQAQPAFQSLCQQHAKTSEKVLVVPEGAAHAQPQQQTASLFSREHLQSPEKVARFQHHEQQRANVLMLSPPPRKVARVHSHGGKSDEQSRQQMASLFSRETMTPLRKLQHAQGEGESGQASSSYSGGQLEVADASVSSTAQQASVGSTGLEPSGYVPKYCWRYSLHCRGSLMGRSTPDVASSSSSSSAPTVSSQHQPAAIGDAPAKARRLLVKCKGFSDKQQPARTKRLRIR